MNALLNSGICCLDMVERSGVLTITTGNKKCNFIRTSNVTWRKCSWKTDKTSSYAMIWLYFWLLPTTLRKFEKRSEWIFECLLITLYLCHMLEAMLLHLKKNVLSSLRVRASFKYLWHWHALRTRYPSLFPLVSKIAENISHHLKRYVRWQAKPKWILTVHERYNWKNYRMRDLSSL